MTLAMTAGEGLAQGHLAPTMKGDAATLNLSSSVVGAKVLSVNCCCLWTRCPWLCPDTVWGITVEPRLFQAGPGDCIRGQKIMQTAGSCPQLCLDQDFIGINQGSLLNV